jgi:Protein of unknown function (DUF1592)/Protein of unknown function (DUF1588)/Protein of unknown function (DUF1587)/Protein of unknown function (DUF1595)/Protein of unknown function (DUF1585)
MKASFDPGARSRMPALRLGGMLCAALVCGAVACQGQIGGGPSGNGPGGGASGPGPLGAGVDPGTKGIHRLNSVEYNNTVADVLGTTLQPASSAWLGGEIGGFDNIASVLDIDDAQYQRYFDAAGAIADDVFAAPALKAKILVCTTQDAACVQSIIGTTGRRLLRRPLTPDDIATYNKVYAAAMGLGETHEGSVKQVLRALLSSSEFLYRIETDPTPDSLTKHPLGAYELASRLSYFLWSSAPDDVLLAAAADNSLLQDATLRTTIDRMLADPNKSTRFVQNFVGQWLGARKLPDHAADPTIFPDWSAPLATSLTQEIYLYFTEFLNNDRSYLDFMKADVNFVDANVAKLYGVPAGTGSGMQRVEITSDQRFGFAGLGGFLALSSQATRTSPTLRGRWILSNLLCQEPPPPPKGVPDLGGVGGLDPTKNIRVALEAHRQSAACAACHSSFDGYGLSLENFDAIGRYRTTYADGSAIDASAQLAGGISFSGLQGLADTVSKDPRFSQCIAQFMFTYGLGRLVTPADQPYLAKVNADWLKGTPTIRRLVQSLVLADTFRFRNGAVN